MNSIQLATPVTASLDDPLYYLKNFRFVLAWVAERYGDLLSDGERAFIAEFDAVPEASQALLVRMVMRKGTRFRTAKLRYAEIGDTELALSPLIARDWVKAEPSLEIDALFSLLTKAEIARALKGDIAAAGLAASRAKSVLLEALSPVLSEPRPLSAWWPEAPDRVVELSLMETCDRLRLMFFGNLRQDWAEFVLTELGHQRFEAVEFSVESRAFQSREEIDAYLHLHRLRERFDNGEPLRSLWRDVPHPPANPWLASRRAKLLFKLAREAERQDDLEMSRAIYVDCAHPEARIRLLRLLERGAEYRTALALAERAMEAPRNEAEVQHLERLLPRLYRRLKMTRPNRAAAESAERIELRLPRPRLGGVESAVCAHLGREQAPVRYVENTLIGGLFGLLCWRAIFAPLPGAFFHPFHVGPADLTREDFVTRRCALFDACLAELDDGRYPQTIREIYRTKYGLASPFVHWGVLDESLLDHTLACVPAVHLKALFTRLLDDLKANRAGLPDLIQLWPEREAGQPRYRLIEVKGPGDRLQDNQRRWLAYFRAHGIPVAVCHVQWLDVDGDESGSKA